MKSPYIISVDEAHKINWDKLCGFGQFIPHTDTAPVRMTLPPDKRLHACNYCNTTARGESLCPNCGAPR